MSRTYRNVPDNKWTRTPRYKRKLNDGMNSRHIVTERDEKPIAAVKECRYQFTWALRGHDPVNQAVVDAFVVMWWLNGWTHIEPGFEHAA